MPRERWAFLLDPLMEVMRASDFGSRKLDVRENIAFQGKGELARFVHDRFTKTGCAIAIEFKKFYMDEWTGEPDMKEMDGMSRVVNHVEQNGRANVRTPVTNATLVDLLLF